MNPFDLLELVKKDGDNFVTHSMWDLKGNGDVPFEALCVDIKSGDIRVFGLMCSSLAAAVGSVTLHILNEANGLRLLQVQSRGRAAKIKRWAEKVKEAQS